MSGNHTKLVGEQICLSILEKKQKFCIKSRFIYQSDMSLESIGVSVIEVWKINVSKLSQKSYTVVSDAEN